MENQTNRSGPKRSGIVRQVNDRGTSRIRGLFCIVHRL